MIINLKSQTDLSGFYIVYEGSTNLERPGWLGISHLMEHLMCNNFDHLQEDFDRDGINYNAYTTSNEIVFYLTGLDEKINKWKYKFIELLSNFDVSKKEFENERNIVIEEYLDTMNDQINVHFSNLSRKLFNDYGPMGLKKDLENMKFMDCINFYELQYLNPTKIINVSKSKPYKNNTINFSDKKIIKTFEYSNHDVPLELNNEFKDKTSIIILSPIINEDFAYINFINSMLSLGLKSPLYQELREKNGLVYYIHCYQQRMNRQGLISISTQTSNKNYNKIVDIIENIIKNPKKYLTKDRFNIVKDYYNIRKKKNEILRYKNVNKWINPEEWNVENILDTINMKKVKEIYDKYYNFNNFYISNDKKEFKKTINK